MSLVLIENNPKEGIVPKPERTLVDAVCINCGKKFKRNIGVKYLRKNGSLTCSSYCNPCSRVRQRKSRARKSDDIMALSTYENMGVRFLSQAEIDEVEPLYSKTILSPKKQSLPYFTKNPNE